MKKLFYFLAAITLFVGCSDDSTNEIPESEAKITFVSDVANLVATQEATTLELKFNTTHDWTAKVDADWCSVEPFYGPKGDVVAAIKVAAYDGEESRQATVTIKAGAAVETFKVNQLPAGKIVVGEKNKEIGYEGGVVTISVAHNIDFTVEIEEAAQAWISEASRALPTTDVTLSVMANEGDARTGKVYIKGEGITEEVVISQAAWVPTFTTNVPDDGWFYPNYEAQVVEVVIDTNVDFTFTLDATDGVTPDWLTIEEAGEGKFNVTLQANPEFYYRTATATISCELLDEPIAVGFLQGARLVTDWQKTLTTDYGYAIGTPARVALYGDYLLVTNGNKVHAVNAADGSFAQTITLPEGFLADNLCVDEGGNIIIAANAMNYNWDAPNDSDILYIFTTKSLDQEPQLLVNYHTANVWHGGTGNIRVTGNIDTEAVIVAVASSSAYWIAWEAKNGEVAKDVNGWSVFTANTLPVGFWNISGACAIAAGSKLSDGLYFQCYDKDGVHYEPFYCANPSENSWVSIAEAVCDVNDNPASLSIATVGDKTYLATYAGAHFSWDYSVFDLIDVTNPAAPARVSFVSGWYYETAYTHNGTTQYNDVLLKACADGTLDAYVVDSTFDMISKFKIYLD